MQIAQKNTHEKVVRRKGNQPKNIRRQKLYLLQGLPGIGRKSALILLKHFGCVEKVFTATQEELCCVDGIGKITAKKIRTILTEFEKDLFWFLVTITKSTPV